MYVTFHNEFSSHNPVVTKSADTSQMRTTRVKSGEALFREGDTAHRVYEIQSGVLRLSRVMENGRRQVIAFGYPGDIVGFPHDGEHHTDCEALTPVQVVAHSRETLECGKKDPETHKRLINAAMREIGNMQDHFMMLGRKSASEKVASFLAVLNERSGLAVGKFSQLELPMSRSDIADFLGLTTETVCRTLTQLRKSGVIALDQVHIVVVLKPDALMALAERD